MSGLDYPPGFYAMHEKHQAAASKERRLVREYPPEIPQADRESVFSSMAYYGRPGCLPLDTMIPTKTDCGAVTRTPLRELIGRTVKVLSYDWNRHCLVPALAIGLTEIKTAKVCQVRMSKDREFLASSDHKFFKKQGATLLETPVGHLSAGDKITLIDGSAKFQRITSIDDGERVKCGDLHVPIFNNFLLTNHVLSKNSGKTMTMVFDSLQRFGNLRRPEFGVPNGMKIVVFDLLGKGEYAAAGLPISDSHPLFEKCVELGYEPAHYPVEVFVPLAFVEGRPYLRYQQPNIVRPFTLALQDFTAQDWSSFVNLTPSQSRLHDAVVNKVRADPNWPGMTMQDLFVNAQGMLGSRRVGFQLNIEGLESAESIPLGSHVYSSKEASGLLQRYEKLMATGIIVPEQWKGSRVQSNLDVRRMLEGTIPYDFGDGKPEKSWPISVFLLPDIQDAPFLNYAIANYVLQRIFWLKHPNTRDRVKVPISVCIPEAARVVPREIHEPTKRYFMEPLKSTIIKLAQQAPGMGIQLSVDTQRPLDLDEGFRDTNANLKLFDLGENASEDLKILLKGRSVANLSEITDPQSRYFTALQTRGNFIYIGVDTQYAESYSNAIPPIWYPRSGAGSKETETSYYELYQRFKPDDWVNISESYGLLRAINLEAMRLANAQMNKILDEEEVKGKKKAIAREVRKVLRYTPEQTKALRGIGTLLEETKLTHWDSYTDFTKRLGKLTGIKYPTLWKILGRFNSEFLILDDEDGQMQMRVTLLPDAIKAKLRDLEAMNAPAE